MTSIRSIAGTSSSRSHTSGVATLYGRLATSVQRSPPAQHGRPVERHRVGLDDRHVRVRSADDLAQHAAPRSAVDLDRGDVGAGLGQRQRQRAEAGADLDDLIAGSDAGEAGDPAHGVGVGDEVLAEVAARCRADAVEQVVDRLDGEWVTR